MVFKPAGLSGTAMYWAVAAVLVPALVISAFMIQTAWRGARLEYRLEEGGLTIVWGRPIRVPYHEIQAVRHIEGRPRLRRIVGTAIGGLNVGRFHLAEVGTIRLYAGRIGQNLVVVDTVNHGRLGLTPENPREFVEELQRRIPSRA